MLFASVTQVPGQLILTCETVRGARSFPPECALITDGEPLPWTTRYIGGQLKQLDTNLTLNLRGAVS